VSLLLVHVGFFALGYVLRGLIEKLQRTSLVKQAEFLWFNPQVFQWERINRNSGVSDSSRVLMGIPVEPTSIDLEQIHEFQKNKMQGDE
jgi:hypothetical protein